MQAEAARAETDGARAGGHALVTGAGSGMGAAVAARLAAGGLAVTLVGRRRDRLEAVAAGIGPSARAAPADVTDRAALAAAVEAGVCAFGDVSVLVCAAGLAASAPVAKTERALLDELMAVNVGGVLEACRLVLPGMVARGHGRIVAIASTAGLRGYAYAGAYAASKHAVVGLVRSLALEVARQGVTANCLCPGFADTEMTAGSIATIMERTGRTEAEARAALAGTNPMKRLVTVEEVADAVAWLAGPGASAVTGQAIAVAGGEVTA